MSNALWFLILYFGLKFGFDLLNKAVSKYMVRDIKPRIAADKVRRAKEMAEHEASKPASNSAVINKLKSEMAELAERTS